jgi:hypothetical protein
LLRHVTRVGTEANGVDDAGEEPYFPIGFARAHTKDACEASVSAAGKDVVEIHGSIRSRRSPPRGQELATGGLALTGKINAWRDDFDMNQFTSRMG